MPREQPTRNRNGNHQRQPYQCVQLEYRHNRGLLSNQITLRLCYHTEMMSALLTRRTLHWNILSLLQASYLTTSIDNKLSLRQEAMLLFSLDQSVFSQILRYYQNCESSLCDILPEDDANHRYGPAHNRTIDVLSEFNAHQFTRFSKSQLRRIYRCFRLPPITRIGGYSITGQEMFLFSLTKMALGLNTHLLSLLIFGGSSSRWYHAYKYFLNHLVDCYYPNVLGLNGLEREVQNFPYYAKKIARKINQERIQLRNNTFEQVRLDSVTVNENNFAVCQFLDGSVTRTTRCGSGPNGDYVGAQRKDDWEINQESIYSGYKKAHGLSTLTLMPPTGIHYIYGPVSMRENDRWLQNQSGVDNFLFELQRNNAALLNGRIYRVYGDNTFINGRCVRCSHRGDALHPLPERLRLENASMKAVRIGIEHAYAEVANCFRICSCPSEFKLMQQNPHAREQLMICYLLSNIYTCLNGSQVSARDFFFCVGPTLEEYLQIRN